MDGSLVRTHLELLGHLAPVGHDVCAGPEHVGFGASRIGRCFCHRSAARNRQTHDRQLPGQFVRHEPTGHIAGADPAIYVLGLLDVAGRLVRPASKRHFAAIRRP